MPKVSLSVVRKRITNSRSSKMASVTWHGWSLLFPLGSGPCRGLGDSRQPVSMGCIWGTQENSFLWFPDAGQNSLGLFKSLGQGPSDCWALCLLHLKQVFSLLGTWFIQSCRKPVTSVAEWMTSTWPKGAVGRVFPHWSPTECL